MVIEDTIKMVERRPVECPACGQYVASSEPECLHCGYQFSLNGQSPQTATRILNREPLRLPVARPHADDFGAERNVMLQFLPSGTCHTLALPKRLILGRHRVDETADFLDLSEFNADEHGVSRQHCTLERQDNRLVVTDLGSSNGTYLNGHRLTPRQGYILTHGDRLILGSLHLTVTFTT